MMVDIRTLIYIVIGLISIGGTIGAFFTMQTKQNMKIEVLEREVDDVKRKQSLATGHQIETEKTLGILLTKIDRLLKDMEELKKSGCGRCNDGSI